MTDAELLPSQRACCDGLERGVGGDEFFGGEALRKSGNLLREVAQLVGRLLDGGDDERDEFRCRRGLGQDCVKLQSVCGGLLKPRWLGGRECSAVQGHALRIHCKKIHCGGPTNSVVCTVRRGLCSHMM